jgi:hypothetical protein
MIRTRRTAVASALATVTAIVAVGAAQATPSDVTAAQLTAGFKKATGQKLLVNRQLSSAGHYVAFDLGVPTITKRARYGIFTIYLVSSTDVQGGVDSLLRNLHTGQVDPPAPGGIYWEQDSGLGTGLVWVAKHRYGPNVVLSWSTTSDEKKTDKTFKRLHKALQGIVGH